MKAPEDRDFVQSLERGLSVMLAFGGRGGGQTLADIAKSTGLSRPTARRLLLTLKRLGYVGEHDARYTLTSRVLALADAYRSSVNFVDIATTHIEHLVDLTQESSSIAVLEDTDVVYVARVPAKRIMSINLSVGSRLPAHATAMGRVLLANLDRARLDDYFSRAKLLKLTSSTVDEEGALRKVLSEVRAQGWALVDQELEEGLRSIAAPIRGDNGSVIAAINVSTHAGRVDTSALLDDFLPTLRMTAAAISRELGAPRTNEQPLRPDSAAYPPIF